MIKKHEMIAAFYTGLEEFLFNHNETKALLEVLNDYVDTLNCYISNYVYKPTNDEDSPVSVIYTCPDNNDIILIQAHKGSEFVTLATINRDNTGVFKEFRHIGSSESITLKGAKHIEKVLFRMLETPALTSALYRLICQSGWPTFNDLKDDKYEAMLIKGSEAIKSAKATAKIDSEITETLNRFCEYLNNRYSFNNHKFNIEFSDDVPFELSIIREKSDKVTLIKLKTQYGTYPVTLRDDTFGHKTANNQDELIKMVDDKISSIPLLS